MKYDIYFHNDFDGRASAAAMLAFLRSRGDDIAHFVPVDFDLQDAWADERFFEKHKLFKGKKHPAIVVDFLYHPAAAWWFDHHGTTFKKEKWRKNFKTDKFHAVNPQCPSCAHLVYDSLKRDFGWRPPRLFAELIRWIDIIDAAKYRSALQTIQMKEPALQVDAFIDETNRNRAGARKMVELLAVKRLTEISRMPVVKKAADKVRSANRKSLIFYRKNLKRAGKATVIDLREAPVKTLRFAPYYLMPRVPYAVRCNTKGKLYYIGVSANPWRRAKRPIHIGKLLAAYGGGGHAGAGGAYFKTKSDADRALPKILKALNK